MDSTVSQSEEPPTENDEEVLVPADNGKKCFRDVIASLIACIGALMMGLVIGYSSPALTDEHFTKILKTEENKVWFGSLMAIGALFGGPIGGELRSRLGLKLTLISLNLPMGLGWFMILIGQHVPLILAGRILTGLGAGMVSLAVPIYVTEVAEKSRRGILGCCFQLAITIGILQSYVFGVFLSWNYLALVCLAISLFYTGMMLIVPESPRWFISKNKPNKALESLKWLHNNDQRAEIELAFLESFTAGHEAEQEVGMSLSDLSRPEIYKPILIGMGLMIFQQMTGINTIIFYLASVFSNAGFGDNVALPTIVVGIMLVLSTAVSCSLIDCLGRRVLLLFSGISMAASLAAFGTFYYLVNVVKVTTSLSWLSLTSVSAFICAFSLGWSSIPWLATAEIMPPKAKSFGLGLTTVTNWLFAFLTTNLIDTATKILKQHGTMWAFGVCCLLGCLFVALCLPETKGRSLEEIQKQFAKNEVAPEP